MQATETGTDVDVQASTHGYLYELFIKSTIAKRGALADSNIVLGYLSHVAFELFTREATFIGEHDFEKLHERLNEEFEVLPHFKQEAAQLIEAQMLVKREDSYTFKHRYIYYYFLASYLSDHISDEGVRRMISKLASTLYREESANTLLFMAHLCKDKYILDTLLDAAERQYRGEAEARLEDDVKFLNELDNAVGKMSIPERPLEETRAEILEQEKIGREQETEFEKQRREEIEDAGSALGKLSAALKTVQILGQYLKNFPVGILKADKDRIINACCSVSRRALASYLNLVKTNETAVLGDMLFLISRRRPDFDDEKLRERATMAVVSLCEIFTTGMIYRLSSALGSRQLAVTFDRVFEERKEAFLRIVYVSLTLESASEMPETLIRDESREFDKNPFAFRVLRYLVARHLALFPVDFKTRQRLSEMLSLEYRKIVNPRKEQRLIT